MASPGRHYSYGPNTHLTPTRIAGTKRWYLGGTPAILCLADYHILHLRRKLQNHHQRHHALDPYSDGYYDVPNVFFKPYYSPLPGFSESSKNCIPKAFECTDWQHDHWAGNGSYSNFQIGLKHADGDAKTYREDMSVSRGIWFAGEATTPFAALGTVTSAYWSGEAIGRKILDMYGLAGKKKSKKRWRSPLLQQTPS